MLIPFLISFICLPHPIPSLPQQIVKILILKVLALIGLRPQLRVIRRVVMEASTGNKTTQLLTTTGLHYLPSSSLPHVQTNTLPPPSTSCSQRCCNTISAKIRKKHRTSRSFNTSRRPVEPLDLINCTTYPPLRYYVLYTIQITKNAVNIRSSLPEARRCC